MDEKIGECLLLLKRKSKARSYSTKAYAWLSQGEWMMANEAEQMTRMKELSGFS